MQASVFEVQVFHPTTLSGALKVFLRLLTEVLYLGENRSCVHTLEDEHSDT